MSSSCNTFTLSAPRYQKRKRVIEQLNMSQEMLNQYLSPRSLQQKLIEDQTNSFNQQRMSEQPDN